MNTIDQKIDQINEKIANFLSWPTLFMALLTFVIVVLRYLLNLGWVWMQELVIYMHALVFLGASGYALQKDAHVRVDIFYQRFSPRKKALVNLFGVLFLLLPSIILIFIKSLPFVADSWKVLEGSKDGGGLEMNYILKTFILVFCLLLILQAISLAIKSVRDLTKKGV
jgi:TRAP-type mannitol/chloroaromatic compound transport system permease small subunit